MLYSIQEKVKQLKNNITSSAKDYFNIYKDTDAIKFINRTINKLNDLIKAIDKFLKQKGLDVEKIYNDIKDNAIPFAKKIKTKGLASLKLLKDKASNTAIGKKIIEKGTIVSNKLKSMFSNDTEKENGPPEKYKKDSSKNNKKEPEKEGWLSKLINRQTKRKEEIEAEKKAVLEKVKENKKSKENEKNKGWLGTIIAAITGLGGIVVKGIKSALAWAGGFLLKGMKNLLGKLGTYIVDGVSSLVSNFFKFSGKAAWETTKAIAKKALPIAGRVLGFAARGAIAALASPIGVAIAIGTAIYLGYKLYKYLTRGDLSKDIYGELTRLRLMMYGYDGTKKNHYAKLFDLDMLMKDYIEYKDHKVFFKNLKDKELKEKVLKIFEVTPEEKDKFEILNTWFYKRYLPAYMAYVKTLYSVNNSIYFDNIDKLKPIQIFDLLSKLNIPISIYNILQVPFFNDPTVRVSKEDIDNLRNKLISEVNKDLENKGIKNSNKIEKKPEPPKSTTKNTNISQNNKNTTSKSPPVINKPNENKENKNIDSTIDTEPKPKDIPIEDISNKANIKLNVAQGQLFQGSDTLEGITTNLAKEKITNLNPNVRELFTGMAKEYNVLTGKTIPVVEAFRTYEDQKALYNKDSSKAAKPGTSLHEYGLAIDIDSKVANELDKLGLMRKYGFTRPVGQERWHIEPIGVSVNPTLAKEDEAARFDAIISSPSRGGGGYGTLPDSKKGKRNINLQAEIYNKNTDIPIDPSKIKIEGRPNNLILANKLDPILIKKDNTSTTNSPVNTSTTNSAVNTYRTNSAVNTYTTNSPVNTSITNSAVNTSTTNSAVNTYRTNSAVNTYTTNSPVNTSTTNSAVNTYRTNSAVNTYTTNSPVNTSTTNSAVNTYTIDRIVKNNPLKEKNLPDTLLITEPVVKSSSNIDIGRYANLSPEQAIKEAAKLTGVDETTLLNFAKIESSLNSKAKAKTSSAEGLFQITDSTWKELIAKYGSKYNIPPNADKTNNFYNSVLAAEYAKENISKLPNYQKTGIEEDTAMYLAHHYGLSGAKKIINQLLDDPNVPIQNVVSSSTFRANRQELQNNTVASYIEKVNNKLDKASVTTYLSQANISTTPRISSNSIKGDIIRVSADTSSTISTLDNKPPRTPKPQLNYPSTITMSTDRSLISKNNIPDIKQNQPFILNTEKMENMLSDQLTALTQIVTILSSIDDKIDLSKLKDILPKNNPIYAQDKSQSNTSVNLSRKTLVM